MEAKHTKTAQEKMQDEKTKDLRKKSTDIVDPMSGALDNAKKPMTSLTAATQSDAVASGKRQGFSADELSEVKTLDDEPKDHAAQVPAVDLAGRLPDGSSVRPGVPNSFDRNEDVAAAGAHNEHGAKTLVHDAGNPKVAPDVMRNAGEAVAPSGPKTQAPNKR